MPKPYQYGVRHDNAEWVERHARRADAETAARDWAISPLRTGPRSGHLVRRRGWDGEWVIIATWSSPEAPR